MIRTQKVRLYPNATMKRHLDELCDYRRFCWNQALAVWNDMYDAYLLTNDKSMKPTWQKVQKLLIFEKQDWQYYLAAHCQTLAVQDLGNAWKNFFNKSLPDWGKPKFKSKKSARQGFKSDVARIVDGKLRLEKPQLVKVWYDIPFKGEKSLSGDLKTVSVYRENGKYYASLPFETTVTKPAKTKCKTAVDVNVGHFNYTNGKINTLPSNLQHLYKRIKHYQKMLAKKRQVNGKQAIQSHNYGKTRAKLQRDYHKVANIQRDIIQKFTTNLVTNYDTIVIENLDVKKMQMTHVASKGLQRSLFGYFRQVLTYKCNWYSKDLIIADKYYPSTQRCSNCGYVKTADDKITLSGNQKHQTKHNEYVCYQCGFEADRDENAVMNLLYLA